MKTYCAVCFTEIEGGTYLTKVVREPTEVTFNNKDGGTTTFQATKTKCIYFCSGECLDDYEKRDKNEEMSSM